METIKYTFISYSRHDRDFVERLANDLRSKGILVWIDLENITPGANWQSEIENGIKKASVLIFVLSQHSTKSKWMLTELDKFSTSKKKILPIIIEDIDPKEIPANIANIQWSDFRSSYEKGLNSLLTGLGIDSSKASQPVKTKKKKTKGYAFLSYVEDDTDFIKSLKEFLKKHGYAYWDYEESDRDYHNQLFLELEGIIIEATTTLSVLSEAWKHSQWAIKEFFFSQDVGTPVFLLKAKEISPTLAIAGMTFIDFTKNNEKGFQKLDKELKRKKL